MSRAAALIPILFPALLLAGCVEAAGPRDGHLLHGTILDAETGAPVSREDLYAHFFCDAADFQLSLDPEDESTYAVRTPEREVRVLVACPSGRYERFEQRVTITGDDLAFDVRLRPTHWVRLFGTVTDTNTGKPVSFEGDGSMGSAPILEIGPADRGRVGRPTTGKNGVYSILVPRTLLRVDTLDTPLSPVVREVDLTDFTGDERRFDVDLR